MGESTCIKAVGWKSLVNFFVLGLVVFVLKTWFEKPAVNRTDERLVEITSADIEWFRNLWKKRMGREPTVEEMRAQVNQLIREHILNREAERLGMAGNDEVVRRRLAQKMDFFIKDIAAGIQPNEQELQDFLEANRARYTVPGETTFEQVFFKTDERGEAAAQQAVALFLNQPDLEGDPTMLPRWNENLTGGQVEGLYGKAFSEGLQDIETGKWAGPLYSSYGLHAVLVHERSPAEQPSVDQVRELLLTDWRMERQAETAERTYEQFRGQYTVLVEGMPYSLDME
jgi:parvulin-like peptidyl-prolyl isomerase